MEGTEGLGSLPVTMPDGRSHDAIAVATAFVTAAQWQSIADSMDRVPAARAATAIVLTAAHRHGSSVAARHAVDLLVAGLRDAARSVNLKDFARIELFVTEAMDYAELFRHVRSEIGAHGAGSSTAKAAAGEAAVLMAVIDAATIGSIRAMDVNAALPGTPATSLAMVLARADEAFAAAVESDDPADRRLGWYGRTRVAVLTGHHADAGRFAGRLADAGTDAAITQQMVHTAIEEASELQQHRNGGNTRGRGPDKPPRKPRRFF